MNNLSLVTRLFLAPIGLFLFCGCAQKTSVKPSIIPLPQEITMSNGVFKLTADTRVISLDPAISNTANELIDYFDLSLIKEIENQNINQLNKAIILNIDSNIVTHNEGYQLDINPKRVVITGHDAAGVYWGYQTLKQIAPISFKELKSAELPSLIINDYPRFAWRGMHLDVSRHFFPKDSILKFIDYLAQYKLNVFHWHLSDDQGWRIEIKKYPLLTEVGAWREDTRHLKWSYDQFPVVNGKPVYGGFYTQEEIKEIVQYADNKHITILPEIDVPGHSWSTILAYPNLSCSGKPFYKPKDVPFAFSDPLCAGNEETYQFLENVFDEIIELFPSKYIHIGGDEAKKTPWEHCAKCQKTIKNEGLENVEELQSYFIKRLGKHLINKGRQYIGWDEILEGGLPDGAAIMSWRGIEGGIKAVKAGQPAVMATTDILYFDKYQSEPSLDSDAQPGICTIDMVYNYDPIPEGLTQDEANKILGVQACLWTEYVQTWNRVQIQLFPRILALSEISWTNVEQKNLEDFMHRVSQQYNFLIHQGIDFYIPAPAGLANSISFLKGSTANIELANPLGTGEIVYTTNGELPNQQSKRYNTPIQLKENCTLTACIILPNGKIGTVAKSKIDFIDPEMPISSAEESQLEKGISYTYFEGDFTTLDIEKWPNALKKGKLNRVELISERAEDRFALLFEGFIKIDSLDIYTFSSTSDDGSRIYVNGKMIVDNDGVHGKITRSGSIGLNKGIFPIRIEYFEGNYGEILEIEAMSKQQGKFDINERLYTNIIPDNNSTEYTELFNGNSFSGWRNFNSDKLIGWTIEDGCMLALGLGGDHANDIITNRKYKNFDLIVEWKQNPQANSGIFILAEEQKEIYAIYEIAPEYQLIDEFSWKGQLEEWQKTGAAYAMYVPKEGTKKLNPLGQFNVSRIVVNKGKVEHYLNGAKLLEYQLWSAEWDSLRTVGKWKDFPKYGAAHEGHIGLQDHGNKTWFKRVAIRELK
jgi:hexosaminidase